MAIFLSNYVFPARYSLGATQIQDAQTRLTDFDFALYYPLM